MFKLNPETLSNTIFVIDLGGPIASMKLTELVAALNEAFGVTLTEEALRSALADESVELAYTKAAALNALAQLLGIPDTADHARLEEIHRQAMAIDVALMGALLHVVGEAQLIIMTNIDPILLEALNGYLKSLELMNCSLVASCKVGSRKPADKFFGQIGLFVKRHHRHVVIVDDVTAIGEAARAYFHSGVTNAHFHPFDPAQGEANYTALEAYLVAAGLATNTEAASS